MLAPEDATKIGFRTVFALGMSYTG